MANNNQGQRNNNPNNGNNNRNANRNNTGFGRTRAGIEADFSEGYNLQAIPCNKIAQHINELVRTVVNTYNDKVAAAGGSVSDQLNIQGQCFVIPLEFSKKFAPCIVVIPDDWVITSESMRGDDELIEFYSGRDEDEDKVISLYPPIRDVISKFMYSKADEGCFFSSMWRKEHDISSSAAIKLKNLRPCKRQTISPNKYGKKSVIHCLLDPARVIHDMAMNPDRPNENFRIINLRFKKKGGKQGSYYCTKKYVSQNESTKNNKEFANVISQLVRAEINKSDNNVKPVNKQFVKHDKHDKHDKHEKHEHNHNNDNKKYYNDNYENDNKKRGISRNKH